MSAKGVSGSILSTLGWAAIVIGAAVSVTGVGALCGIPLLIVGIVILVSGSLMEKKDNTERTEKYLKQIVQTTAAAQDVVICPSCGTARQNTSPNCPRCGLVYEPVPRKDAAM